MMTVSIVSIKQTPYIDLLASVGTVAKYSRNFNVLLIKQVTMSLNMWIIPIVWQGS